MLIRSELDKKPSPRASCADVAIFAVAMVSKIFFIASIISTDSIRPDGRGESVEMMEAMKKIFETIATAKMATSAHEARGLGFLSNSDRISMNRERVLSDSKSRALELVRAGY